MFSNKMEIKIIVNVNEEKDEELILWPDGIWRESKKPKVEIIINQNKKENENKIENINIEDLYK